jgi:hypothetical protein
MNSKTAPFEVRRLGGRYSKKIVQRAGVYVFGKPDGNLVDHNGKTVGTFKVTGFQTRYNKALRRDEQVQVLECVIGEWRVPAWRKDAQYPVHQDFSLKIQKVTQ